MEQNTNYQGNAQPQMQQPQPMPQMQYQQLQYQQTTQMRSAYKPKREYDKIDRLFALLALVIGLVYMYVTPVFTYPLGGLLFIWGIFGITAAFLCLKGYVAGVLNLRSMVFAVVALALSVSFIVTRNRDILSWSFFFCLIAYIYWVFNATGNSVESRLSELFPLELIKAIFIMPFSNFVSLVSAVKGKKLGITLLWVLLGLILAVIPTAIVCALLLYDDGFSGLLERIYEATFADAFSIVVKIAVGIPIGMYIFGMWVAGVNKDNGQVLTEEKCKRVRTKMQFAPKALVVTAIVPLLIVYVLFFISQWQYYVSAFTGVLPASFSYSEYAREGFFQLCVVSGINLFALLIASLFMKRNADGRSVVMKVLAVIISLFTLVLIATALSKMAIYIQAYGLTQKRVYASWFMVVLGLTFIAVIIGQIFKRMNLTKVLLSIFMVMFGALALSNPDGLIAKYNVDAYMDGRIEEVDIDAMYALGYSGVPEVERLMEWNENADKLDADTLTKVQEYLDYISDAASAQDRNIFSYNIPRSIAEATLERMGYQVQPTAD